MNSVKTFSRAAAALTAAAMLGAPAAYAQKPDATIDFSGGSVAFIGGIHWGGGTLYFHGHKYPLRVGGLSVGSIGASSFHAKGQVYNLKTAKDIEGTYGAASASATAGAGAGGLDMTNGNGVRIKATSTSAGLQLTVAASGVDIRLK